MVFEEILVVEVPKATRYQVSLTILIEENYAVREKFLKKRHTFHNDVNIEITGNICDKKTQTKRNIKDSSSRRRNGIPDGST